MADIEKVTGTVKDVANYCFQRYKEAPFEEDSSSWLDWSNALDDAIELLKSKPDIDKLVKELDDTSKQYEPRPFESINWMLRYEGIMIGLKIAQYVVKGEPIPDKF